MGRTRENQGIYSLNSWEKGAAVSERRKAQLHSVVQYSVAATKATKAFLNAFTTAGFSIEEPDEVLFHKTFYYRYKKRGPIPEKLV